MTRYGLALVIVRCFAVACWVWVLTKIEMLLWVVAHWNDMSRSQGVRMDQTWWLYLFIPTSFIVLGLILWLASRSIARGIADVNASEPEGNMSADEVVLMRVVLCGIGVTALIVALMGLPTVVAGWIYESQYKAAFGAQGAANLMMVTSSTWVGLVKMIMLLLIGCVLLVGSKPLTSLVMRLRKYD